MRRIGIAALALALSGCGGADALDYKQRLEFRFEFTLISTSGKLAPGDRATFLVGDCKSYYYCASPTNIYQVFSGTTNESGAVPVVASVFYDDRLDDNFFSIYIDKQPNRVMDVGDLVWGNDPARFFGIVGHPTTIFPDVVKDGTFEHRGLPGITYTGETQLW